MNLTRFQQSALVAALPYREPVAGRLLNRNRHVGVAQMGMLEELVRRGLLSRHPGQGYARVTYAATNKGRRLILDPQHRKPTYRSKK